MTAAGHRPLTTQIFVGGSDCLGSDAVFAVKKSLIVNFERVDDPALAERYQVSRPFRHADVEIVLQPA